MAAITRTWTGSVSSSWSEPNNWSPAGIPAPSDSLFFPESVTTNDLPPYSSVGPMTFNGYTTVNGNPLTLTGDVSFGPSSNFTCNVDLTLGSNVTFGVHSGGAFNGGIDVNGKTLTFRSTATLDSLNGSGTVSAPTGVRVTGSGTFIGAIVDSEVILDGGSIPNASVNATFGSVAGRGTIGNVTIGGSGGIGPAGVLRTKTLTVASNTVGTYVHLNPGGASDQIQVTGTVTLNGNVWVYFPGAVPSPGQSFTIVDNVGPDAVSGTFAGLPEGATLTTPSGVKMTVSYHGGDGNDVTLTVTGTKTWIGSAGSSWSNPANWTPHAIPLAGEPLIFPSGATMVNDLPSGFTVGAMAFVGDATLSGNPLTLSGDVSLTSSAHFTCNVDVTLGANVTFGQFGGATFNGAIDVNGKTLTFRSDSTLNVLNGSGTVSAPGLSGIRVTGSGTFSGAIVDSGVTLDGASIPNAAVNGEFGGINGHGTIGNVTVGGSGGIGPAGVLHTKNLTVASNTVGTYVHLVPGATSDQIQVIGTVTLNGNLWVSFPGTEPSPGQSFTIIDNDGTDAVSGTFQSLPEGAILTVGGTRLAISYRGGDGNDVTLTRVIDTSTALVQSAQESLVGQPFTLTATVTASVGTPAGTVSFGDGTTTSGTAVLQNGVATFTASTLLGGVHNIVATYLGEGAFLGSASGAVVHDVHRGNTVTSHSLAPGTAVYGSARFDVLTTVVAPAAGDPAGTITIQADGIDLAAGSLSAGHASIVAAALSAGTHVVTAAYSGSTDFEPSQGMTTVTIAKAPASFNISSSNNPSPAGAPLVLKVTIASTAPAVPSGSVVVTENGGVVAQQPITGTTTLLLHPRSGNHTLSVSYSGDDNYLASSATFVETVSPPLLTADAVRVFEGDAGTTNAEIPVRLSAPSDDPISVPWRTTNGTALAGVDYEQGSGTVDFAPGETFHTVIVHVIGNTKREDDKTFSVAFDAAASVQVATTSATVVIANDDTADAPPPTRHRGVRH